MIIKFLKFEQLFWLIIGNGVNGRWLLITYAYMIVRDELSSFSMIIVDRITIVLWAFY